MNTTSRIIKRANLNSNVMWLMILLFIAVITGIAIADKNWLYLGVVFVPFILYLCIKIPFIFPFGLYVFLLPFDSVLSVSGSTHGATLTKLLGVLVILVLSIKGLVENKLKKPDSATIWWILFILFGSLTGFWAMKQGGIVHTTLAGLLVLYLVTSSYKIQKSEFETLKWCILLGGFIAAVYTIYNAQTVAVDSRVTLVAGERNANINAFAFSLLLSVSICVGTILKQNSIYRKGLFGIVLGVIIYCIIITSSRGALLSAGVIFCVYIVSTKQKITYTTILIIVCIILASILPAVFIERWSSAVEGGGAGRIGIWYVGLLSLEKYWALGVGLGNFPLAFAEFAPYAGRVRAAHNIYLGYFVELGIIGFSFLVMAIVKHYQSIRSRLFSNNSDQIMLKAAFFGLLASSFFLDTMYQKTFWLLWMLIMMNRNVSEYK